MFSLFARRVVSSAARVTSRTLLNIAIKSPNVLNRTFTTSPCLLLASARETSTIAQSSVSPSGQQKAAATDRKSRAKPKTKKATEKKVPKKKAAPKPKDTPIHFKPPPRVLTPYSLFIREKVQGKTGIQFKTYIPPLVAEWKALSEAEKQSYRERAHTERLQRLKKFEEFMSTADSKLLFRFNKARREKGKPAIRRPKGSHPKKPLTAFFIFMEELRAKPQFRSWKCTDLSREGGQQWRAMNDAEKAPYRSQAANAAARSA